MKEKERQRKGNGNMERINVKLSEGGVRGNKGEKAHGEEISEYCGMGKKREGGSSTALGKKYPSDLKTE
jgi:hypothetical protein